ncbi:MAG: histidinol-phosphate transaminase [Planctomycetes bacterium]|nr:histidinol-phosphate transaminase [Planctomycetota bacterium]
MTDPLALIKPAVRALGHYTLPPRQARVKVDQNENPWELPDAFKDEVFLRMRQAPWGRYPEFVPRGLLEALARFAGWRPDGVLVGNGSNELISVVLQATVGEGVAVALPQPTFTLYASMVTTLGGRVVTVPLDAELRFDEGALLAAQAREGARVLIVCSPNNPTGSHLDEPALRRLLRAWQGLVVVDEAYQEFTGWSAVPLLAEFPHLVVLRTFSKAMGLAGLRVGYLLARPELATELDKVRLPYNLNRFSTIAAELALERYDELLAPLVARLIDERERLAAAIAALPGFLPYPSRANFLLVRSAWPPGEVHAALAARGVLARDVSRYPMLAECLRVSVGTPEEGDLVLEGLAAFSAARTGGGA